MFFNTRSGCFFYNRHFGGKRNYSMTKTVENVLWDVRVFIVWKEWVLVNVSNTYKEIFENDFAKIISKSP